MQLTMEQKCTDCQEPFSLSEHDKLFYSDRDLALPKRCYYCRQKRRDNNRIDLHTCIGQYIYRTKASVTGDRSFVGEISKIKLLNILEDGTLVFEDKWKWLSESEERTFPPHYNDGYWKVIKAKN